MFKKVFAIVIIVIAVIVLLAAAYLFFNQEPLVSVSIPVVATSTDANGNPLPHLDYLTPEQGVVGATIDLVVENLNGFEGDLNAWIVNSSGETAFLPAAENLYANGTYKTLYPNHEVIRVKISPTLCQSDNEYSGLPCAKSMIITPGSYGIYTKPWGNKSNILIFTVTK